MDLVADNQFKFLKIRKLLGQYLVGGLLMPWIWAWGLLILEFILISYYNFQPKNGLNEFNLLQTFTEKIDLFGLFLTTTFFVFINYTISFFTSKIYPKLGILLFYLSLFLLCVLFSFIWPHFIIVLNQA